MDYSEISRLARLTALSQGVSEDQFDCPEVWYYDETDNAKHLVLLPNKTVNANENTCFVLGGIQADNVITDAELHSLLGKTPGKELKAKKDLQGDFSDILRKETMKKTLEMIIQKGWHIHFMMVQVWYFGFVDIIDSINDDINWSFSLKAILYKILKRYPNETVQLLGKYHYPNVSDKDKTKFLDGLIDISRTFLESKPDNNDVMLTNKLIGCLESSKKNKVLVFIQGEEPDEWVTWFANFYTTEIASYPNKTLILDTEKQVEKAIKAEPIEINGALVNNFKFEDSETNPMIQVCDYVVAIMRKYAIFLARSLDEVYSDINKFDEFQMANFVMLNKILKRSLDKNPLYFHYIASVEMQFNLNHLMAKYG